MITTIKTKFRAASRESEPGSIYIAVTRHRTVRTITTGCKVFPQEWDKESSSILLTRGGSRSDTCRAQLEKLMCEVALMKHAVSELEMKRADYSAQDVISTFRQLKQKQSFLAFMEEIIERLGQLGRHSTGHNYLATLNSLRTFRGGESLDFHELTPELLEEYQAWLQKRGAKPNTVSFYMRNLRAAYNRAVTKHLVIDTKPFASVFTGNERTHKRAITINEISLIKALDLRQKPRLEFARDLFLFLFYCRGMSFVDAAHLRKSNIKGEEIVYRRHKTNQELTVGINKHIRLLLERYGRDNSPYLLPILGTGAGKYSSVLRTVNNSLKKVGLLAGILKPLTTYVSRHSWASIAKSKGIPTSLISDALGHDSEQTTQIYLASISNDAINKANELVLNEL